MNVADGDTFEADGVEYTISYPKPGQLSEDTEETRANYLVWTGGGYGGAIRGRSHTIDDVRTIALRLVRILREDAIPQNETH